MRKKARMYGEVRIINKFLWFKKAIGNEIRWFEHVKIKQAFRGYCTCYIFLLENWADIEWVDRTYHGII